MGVKVFAYKRLSHVADRALRYALALPLATVIVGCSTLGELKRDLDVAEHFAPMSAPERLALFPEALPLVKPQNMPWEPVYWSDPMEWKPRTEPAWLED